MEKLFKAEFRASTIEWKITCAELRKTMERHEEAISLQSF